MAKFRNRVSAYGTFVIEAADMYEADEIARQMSEEDILSRVIRWDMEVNDDEFPEEVETDISRYINTPEPPI